MPHVVVQVMLHPMPPPAESSPILHLPGLQGADPVRPQLRQLPPQLLQRRNCVGCGRGETAAVSSEGTFRGWKAFN